MKLIWAAALTITLAAGADLGVSRVVLYKNGVALYERSGAIVAGEPARLEFKAVEMDDVLKSLILEAPGGVARVRYELNEPLAKRLADQGVQLPAQAALAVLLDQWRGARVELKYRGEATGGAIVSGRLAALPNQGQRQELTILKDSGELVVLDLDAATNLKLADARLQQQFSDALLAIAQSRSKEKRTVWIDTGNAVGKLVARYLAPAPVWKSSYRLVLPDTGEATMEGWAIIDNATGEDWKNIDLTVVSGKPVSFISRLYEPKYVQRAEASLAEDKAAAPVVYESSMNRLGARAKAVGGVMASRAYDAAPAPPPPAAPMMAEAMSIAPSEMVATSEAREAGELFEYRFAGPVSAHKGESLLLPFVQQRLSARKLLIYSDRSQANPRNAAELTNTTGKTLDGGPITVYHPGGYSGEALMETLKNGEKRLISYSVDQGTRVTTNQESGSEVIRSVKAYRGLLTTRTAVKMTTTYTVDNADAKAKSLAIEHPIQAQMKLLQPKADETTAKNYRFMLALEPHATAKLSVVEEQEIASSVSISSLTPDDLLLHLQQKSLPTGAKPQLEAIAAKKNQVAEADNQLKQIETEMAEIEREQNRLRQNISSLRAVAGQQEQVNRYASEMGRSDVRLAELRDQQSGLRKRRAALQGELTALIEKLSF
jgi:hypothetical protein